MHFTFNTSRRPKSTLICVVFVLCMFTHIFMVVISIHNYKYCTHPYLHFSTVGICCIHLPLEVFISSSKGAHFIVPLLKFSPQPINFSLHNSHVNIRSSEPLHFTLNNTLVIEFVKANVAVLYICKLQSFTMYKLTVKAFTLASSDLRLFCSSVRTF